MEESNGESQRFFEPSREQQRAQPGRLLAENPLPAAMLWIGASWLAMKALSGGRMSATRPPTEKVRDTVDAAATTAGETVGSVMTTTQDVVGRVLGGAQGALMTVAQAAPQKAGQVTGAIGSQAVRAQANAGRMFEENPMILTAAAVAGGIALGLVAPTTKAETEALARPTTKLVERAETFATQAVDSMESGRA